jgi:thymidylate kinase
MGKKSIIHAFSGAHGTGKTTAVHVLAERMRQRYPDGQSIGILTERARECPCPVLTFENKFPSAAAQLWIFTDQINMEIDMMTKYDVIITDRTIVDCIAYTVYFKHLALAEAMIEMAEQHMSVYSDIFFRRIETNPYLMADGFRLNLYQELDVPVVLV